MSIIEIKVPALGESITEATVGSWLKSAGQSVKRDETLCELESDKATVEVPAEADGVLIELAAQAGETLKVGAVLGKIDTSATGAEPAAAPAAQAAAEPAGNKGEAKTEAPAGYAAGVPSPSAAKLLREQGLDAGQVSGSGRGGRITKADARQAASAPAAAPAMMVEAPAQALASASSAALPAADERGSRREKMSPLRRTVARRLVAVKNETAMLTTFNEVDMFAVMELRRKYKDAFKEKYGVGLGFMSFFTAASCVALQEFPAVNAQIDGDEVIYHDYCDIGVAVSAPKGLVVPVLRNAEHLNLDEIEREILNLAQKARQGKISLDEMSGGTFTITNGGVFGSMLSTPIINAPQCAILGMHNIVERPVAIGGEVRIRPIMYLALSYDHRLIDGREAVGFLVRIKQLIEDPTRLILGV